VPSCTLPLTATGAVSMIITELAVFVWRNGRLTLIELMPGATLAEVEAKTTAAFAVDDHLIQALG
jgi:3-oxoacid CoA-transferase